MKSTYTHKEIVFFFFLSFVLNFCKRETVILFLQLRPSGYVTQYNAHFLHPIWGWYWKDFTIYWKTSGLYFPGRESAKGAFRKCLIRGSWWKIKSSSLYLAVVFLQANDLHFPSLFHIFSYLCVKEIESYQGLWKSQGKAGMSTCCHDAVLFTMVHENQYWLV